MSTENWYAVYTKSRHEKQTATELKKQGVHVFLPLVKTIRQWSDRKKKIEVPLFNSYVFVKIDIKDQFYVLQADGAVKFIAFENKPVPIPEWQINNLKVLLNTNEKFEITFDDFEPGEEVTVNRGPLRGLRGKLIRYKGTNRVLISIDSINQSLIVDIHPALLEKRMSSNVNRSS